MLLSKLLEGVEYEGNGLPLEAEIEQVTCDSRRVTPQSVFVCVRGTKSDGHQYAAGAVQRGAKAVVTDYDLGLEHQILVPNTRRAYALMCGNLNGNPAAKLKLLAVTGTNAKTTITYVLKHILEHAGKKTGLIGTIQNEIGDLVFPAKHTTPDPAELHALFSRMAQAGCEYVVMEASSHALDQERLAGCRFVCGIFTNLTQDHLDYHITMENYYQAKRKLFDMCESSVINVDDAYGQRLFDELAGKKASFAALGTADFSARESVLGQNGCTFQLEYEGKRYPCSFRMPGRFSISNALAAIGCAVQAGLSVSQAVQGINTCEGVSGRSEVLDVGTDFTVIRDYAHAADSLEKTISTVREFAAGRVITLFGCAGNRDRGKRPKMGEVASRLSDLVIFTSDNPRDESVQQIIDDTMPGLLRHPTRFEVIPDRYQAIRWALEHCEPGDVLLLAGKGHEDYQVLDYGTIYFDEKEIVKDLAGQLGLRKGRRDV